MAEAFLNSMGGDIIEAESAGFEVRELNTLAVAVMKEVGQLKTVADRYAFLV